MIETEKKLVYKAFGFSVLSEIKLPELPKFENLAVETDIEVTIKDLSNQWLELSDEENAFVIQKDLIMFQVPNIATFSIQDGKKISISPLQEYDEDVVRLYVLGTCMGAILMQRKILPLHGSAVAIDGKAYVFMGNSGAGKSTTASSFLSEGYRLLSDDVIAVSISDDGIPYVTPSYPQQKLWQDSINKLGMDGNEFRSIYGRETKYCVPVSSYLETPVPLVGIFELIKTEESEIEIREIKNLEKFHTLYYNTYQNCFIPNSGLMDWHFNLSAKLVNNVDIYQVKRPALGTNPSQVFSQLMIIINKGE